MQCEILSDPLFCRSGGVYLQVNSGPAVFTSVKARSGSVSLQVNTGAPKNHLAALDYFHFALALQQCISIPVKNLIEGGK